MVELRDCELRQDISVLDVIANVDIALGDIAGCAGIDVRGSERGRGAREGHRNRSGVRHDGCSPQTRHEIALLPCSRHDLLLQ